MTNDTALTLVSHHLCPYVQRAVISLTEKGVDFGRVDVDLSEKPDWFKTLSPLGKTPVLRVGERAIFESAVILEYLEDTLPNPLHPTDPIERAEHRSIVEYGSAVLNEIWGFYSADDAADFEARRQALASQFEWLERRVAATPWFAGQHFSLVDTAFGPVFRYFDVFDEIGRFGVFENTPKVARWRASLTAHASVKGAVTQGYEERLWAFLLARKSHLSGLMTRSH